MIDTKLLREDFSNIKKSLLKRGFNIDQQKFESIDSQRKSLQVEVENLQSDRNTISAEFGQKKKLGENTDDLKTKVDQVNVNLGNKEEDLNRVLKELNSFLMEIPNTPNETVPIGDNETENVVIKKCGEITSTNKLDHLQITNDIDTDLATKLAGARFSVLRGDIAKLQRALITFMLDNAIKNGYQEYYVPFMANVDSLTGTGQLPKFEDDLFKSSDKLFLIPTAEVPLTNLFRDEF